MQYLLTEEEYKLLVNKENLDDHRNLMRVCMIVCTLSESGINPVYKNKVLNSLAAQFNMYIQDGNVQHLSDAQGMLPKH